ncbi:hypothetical protein V8E36_002003 [Tilletia maclaganii]
MSVITTTAEVAETWAPGYEDAQAAARSSPWKPQFAEVKAVRTRQLLYVFVMQGLGAALISGGINFAVSVGMYLRQSDITMWILARNTIAGDMGVTVLIQVTITFIITSSLIRGDLRSGLAIPLRAPWPPAPASTGAARGAANLPPSTKHQEAKKRSTFQMLRHNIETFYIVTQQNHIFQAGLSARERFWRLFRTAFQGLLLGCFVFPWFWGIAIAILAPIYSNKQMGGTWIPMVIKGVYGALLGLLTNPLIALMNLGAHDVAGEQPDSPCMSEVSRLEKNPEAVPANPETDSGDTPVASVVAPPRESHLSEDLPEVTQPRTSSVANISRSGSRLTLDLQSTHEDFHSAADVSL